MKHITKVLLLICIVCNSMLAQQPTNYYPLNSRGKLPTDITIPSSIKYKNEIASIFKSNENIRLKRNRKNYSLEANFVLDWIMRSGLVLINDIVSNYLNQIAQKVLEKEDESLRSKVKVYVLKSPEVNAFATERGNIFVTLGLLSKLQNEAQIAFILAHEIIHVRESHNVDMFIETQNLERLNEREQAEIGSKFNKNFLKKCLYSRELEIEADSAGAILFLKTDYDHTVIANVFDVLKFSNIPFSDEDFDYSLFEGGAYFLPNVIKDYAVVEPEGEDENEDHAGHSHPNIGTRKGKMEKILPQTPIFSKSEYLVSEETFKKVVKIAQYEIPMLELHRGNLPNALYTAGILLKEDMSNAYLRKCVAKGLYLQAKHKNSGRHPQDQTEKVEGASQSIYHMFEILSKEELNALALRYIWKLSMDLPNDSEVMTLKSDIVFETYNSVGTLNEFEHKEVTQDTSTNDSLSVENKAKGKPMRFNTQKINDKESVQKNTFVQSEPTKKRRRVRAKTNISSDKGYGEYWRHALDEFKGENLSASFEDARNEKESRKNYRLELRENAPKLKKRGYTLGLDKIVVFNPSYVNIVSRSKVYIDYFKTEKGDLRQRDYILSAAKAAKLDVIILDVNDLKEDEVDKFNDIMYINEWYLEQLDYENLSNTPGLNQSKIDTIIQKYGTKYFLWMGSFAMDIPPTDSEVAFSPFSLFRIHRRILYYSALYDITTGLSYPLGHVFFRTKAQNNFVKAFLFDTFHQIKKKEKGGRKKGKVEND